MKPESINNKITLQNFSYRFRAKSQFDFFTAICFEWTESVFEKNTSTDTLGTKNSIFYLQHNFLFPSCLFYGLNQYLMVPINDFNPLLIPFYLSYSYIDIISQNVKYTWAFRKKLFLLQLNQNILKFMVFAILRPNYFQFGTPFYFTLEYCYFNTRNNNIRC